MKKRRMRGAASSIPNSQFPVPSSQHGEIGIRTLDTGLTPYNGLANRRLQPLGHLSGGRGKVSKARREGKPVPVGREGAPVSSFLELAGPVRRATVRSAWPSCRRRAEGRRG